MGIKAFKHILPEIISVAVFDTSFTQQCQNTTIYIVYRVNTMKNLLRKYGAHGTSHRYALNVLQKC